MIARSSYSSKNGTCPPPRTNHSRCVRPNAVGLLSNLEPSLRPVRRKHLLKLSVLALAAGLSKERDEMVNAVRMPELPCKLPDSAAGQADSR